MWPLPPPPPPPPVTSDHDSSRSSDDVPIPVQPNGNGNGSSSVPPFTLPTPPPNHPINISELCIDDDNFLGHGLHSDVYKAFHPPTGKDYALKRQFLGLGEIGRQLLNGEIQLLPNLDHPNIIKFFGYKIDGEATEFYEGTQLLLEYMDLLSLKGKHLPDEAYLSVVAKQILSGLNYLHSRNIVHNDINPNHLLLNSQGVVKIANFGISQILNNKSMETCKLCIRTAEYKSPESIDDYILKRGLPKAYAYAGDIWSFGLSIWELYVGDYPFLGSRANLGAIKSAISAWESVLMPDTTSPELRNFIACCLRNILRIGGPRRICWATPSFRYTNLPPASHLKSAPN